MKSDEIFRNRKRHEDKNFHLEAGKRLYWVKWLENGLGQSFILYINFSAHSTFWYKFNQLRLRTLLQHACFLIMAQPSSNQKYDGGICQNFK